MPSNKPKTNVGHKSTHYKSHNSSNKYKSNSGETQTFDVDSLLSRFEKLAVDRKASRDMQHYIETNPEFCAKVQKLVFT